MDSSTEQKIKLWERLGIIEQVKQEAAYLEDQAKQHGSTAYLRQARTRGKPNTRFLNNTINNINSANRRIESNELWASRQREKNLQQQFRSSRGRRDHPSYSPSPPRSSSLYKQAPKRCRRRRSESDASAEQSPSRLHSHRKQLARKQANHRKGAKGHSYSPTRLTIDHPSCADAKHNAHGQGLEKEEREHSRLVSPNSPKQWQGSESGEVQPSEGGAMASSASSSHNRRQSEQFTQDESSSYARRHAKEDQFGRQFPGKRKRGRGTTGPLLLTPPDQVDFNKEQPYQSSSCMVESTAEKQKTNRKHRKKRSKKHKRIKEYKSKRKRQDSSR